MNAICRLLFIILFIPTSVINGIFDGVMFVIRGDKHEMCLILCWLSNKLLDK